MIRILLTISFWLILTGCAAVPYEYGQGVEDPKILTLREAEVQFEQGRPNAFVDGLGHYVFSLPSKLILWNWSVENHHISPETVAALRDYIDANGLHNVKVRVNEYAPGGEWSRLVRNREIGGGWRYTLGVLTNVFYTIFPGRVFGGDHYNPYTNTISIYSDHPSIALHEGAHAKDFSQRDLKGLYAAARILPIFPLYQEGVATGDTIGFHMEEKDPEAEKKDYRILYPAYGTYIAGESLGIASWFGPISYPVELVVQVAVAIPGHIVGRIKASQVEDAPEPTDSAAVAEDGL